MKKQNGGAAVVLIIMLVTAGMIYLLLTMLVFDKRADDAEEMDGVETEEVAEGEEAEGEEEDEGGDGIVDRGNRVIRNTKNTLKEHEKRLNDRLKKNLGQ